MKLCHLPWIRPLYGVLLAAAPLACGSNNGQESDTGPDGATANGGSDTSSAGDHSPGDGGTTSACEPHQACPCPNGDTGFTSCPSGECACPPTSADSGSDEIECHIAVDISGAVETRYTSDGCGGIGTERSLSPSWGYAGEAQHIRMRLAITEGGAAPETVLGEVEYEDGNDSYETEFDACTIAIEPFVERPNQHLPKVTDTYVVGSADCGDNPATSASGSQVWFAPFDFVASPTVL